jgi:hypothetical protein
MRLGPPADKTADKKLGFDPPFREAPGHPLILFGGRLRELFASAEHRQWRNRQVLETDLPAWGHHKQSKVVRKSSEFVIGTNRFAHDDLGLVKGTNPPAWQT